MDTTIINNPLKGKFDKITDYFVKVYGEEYRQIIASRLKNAEYVFIDQKGNERVNSIEIQYQEKISNILEEFKKEAQTLLPYHVQNKNNIKLNVEQLFNLEEWATQIYSDELYNIANFFRIITDNPASKKNYIQQEDALIDALNDPDKNQLIIKLLGNFNDLFNKKYKNRLENLLDEKNSLLEMPQPQLEILEQKFYNGLDDFFVNYFNTAFKTHKSKEEMSLILDNSPILIDFLLKQPDFYSIYDRNEYFSLFKNFEKVFHLKPHKTFSEFLADEKFMKIFKNYDLKKEIKEETYLLNIKKSKILSDSSENFEKISNFDMYFKEEFMSAVRNYMKADSLAGFIFASYFPKEDKFKTICVLNSYFGLTTLSAVHELNHIIENDSQIENNTFINKCGFDLITSDLSGITPENYLQEYAPTEIKYKYTNEVINDFLATKVSTLMKNDNFTLGAIEDTPSAYSIAFPFVQDFIQDNMHDIVQVRFDNDFNKVVEKFGKKNLDLLEDGIKHLINIDKNTAYKYNLEIAMKIVNAELKRLGIGIDDVDAIKNFKGHKATPVTQNYLNAVKKIITATENITNFMHEKDSNHENIL